MGQLTGLESVTYHNIQYWCIILDAAEELLYLKTPYDGKTLSLVNN